MEILEETDSGSGDREEFEVSIRVSATLVEGPSTPTIPNKKSYKNTIPTNYSEAMGLPNPRKQQKQIGKFKTVANREPQTKLKSDNLNIISMYFVNYFLFCKFLK